MKELDVMLERFTRDALAHASPQERGALEELLLRCLTPTGGVPAG